MRDRLRRDNLVFGAFRGWPFHIVIALCDELHISRAFSGIFVYEGGQDIIPDTFHHRHYELLLFRKFAIGPELILMFKVIILRLQVYLLTQMDRATLLHVKSTILHGPPSIITRQRASVDSKLLRRPRNVTYLNDNAQTPLNRFVVYMIYSQ